MNTKASQGVRCTAPTVLALLLASASVASAAQLTTQGKSGVMAGDLGLEDIGHSGDQSMRRNPFAADAASSSDTGSGMEDDSGSTSYYRDHYKPKLCDRVRDIGYSKRAYSSSCQSCQGQQNCSGRLELIAAVYGLNEVTGLVRNMYNNGKREFTATEKYFGGSWDCAYKTLRITYRQCGHLVSEIAIDDTIGEHNPYHYMAQTEEVEVGSPATLAEQHGSSEFYSGSNSKPAASQFGGYYRNHTTVAEPQSAVKMGHGAYGHYHGLGYGKHGQHEQKQKYPYYHTVMKEISVYYKYEPKLAKYTKSKILLPSNNCFCCSCPEERAVKTDDYQNDHHYGEDYYNRDHYPKQETHYGNQHYGSHDPAYYNS